MIRLQNRYTEHHVKRRKKIMYKVLGLRMWISLVAYTAVGIAIMINELEPILSGLGHKVTLGTIVLLTQAVIACILMTPMWRVLWRWIPKLNDWIYPDLNGKWDVTIKSNWNRIDKLARSAAGYENKFDILHCPIEHLPSLSSVKMRANIVQSWMNIYIILESDDPDTVIERSETLVVEPIQEKNEQNPNCYTCFVNVIRPTY